MKKRGMKGQATIFIILAVVIVAILIAYFYLRTETQKQDLGREYFEQHGLQPSLANIQDFIVDCLDETSKESLTKIGIQGGYYNKPDYYLDMDWAIIPYYYYEGLLLMPTKQIIENELSSYVDDNLELCLSQINFQDFEIQYSQPKTQSSIKPSLVTFQTNLPMKIEHKGSTATFDLKDHKVTHNSSLNEILEIADFITVSHNENPYLMCVNCLTEMAKEREVYIDFIAYDKDTTLVMILENKTMEEPYLFEFLNKYNLNVTK